MALWRPFAIFLVCVSPAARLPSLASEVGTLLAQRAAAAAAASAWQRERSHLSLLPSESYGEASGVEIAGSI